MLAGTGIYSTYYWQKIAHNSVNEFYVSLLVSSLIYTHHYTWLCYSV